MVCRHIRRRSAIKGRDMDCGACYNSPRACYGRVPVLCNLLQPPRQPDAYARNAQQALFAHTAPAAQVARRAPDGRHNSALHIRRRRNLQLYFQPADIAFPHNNNGSAFAYAYVPYGCGACAHCGGFYTVASGIFPGLLLKGGKVLQKMRRGRGRALNLRAGKSYGREGGARVRQGEVRARQV